MTKLATFALLLLAVNAHALAPNARVTLEPGAERFLKAGFPILSVIVEPAGLFTADGMDSGEVFVTVPASAKGPGTLLAFGADRVFAWDVCVGSADCPAATSILSAKPACPDAREFLEDGRPHMAATVKDDRCLAALRTALAHTEIPADRLRIVLEERVAMPMFREVNDLIAKDPACAGLSSGFYGATLKLTGRVRRAAVDRALWHAFRVMLGSITYDVDKVTFTDPVPPPPAVPPARLVPLPPNLLPQAPPDPGLPEKRP